MFKVGDRVSHAASGKVGIVTYAYKKCVNHDGTALIVCHPDREECEFELSGEYDISVDFDKEIERVEEFLLIKVI